MNTSLKYSHGRKGETLECVRTVVKVVLGHLKGPQTMPQVKSYGTPEKERLKEPSCTSPEVPSGTTAPRNGNA
ncbi:hypothetical protein PHLCEN_2v13013 [Hermanssonia centrifuga]|uniref:Uncharacterized protein n=1 Tax=Hermanssonia centrifuga TaxID=98765 RepID=A0A2R6NFK0_9APHY|nr:hypothetical protein PHLCEN_2v13013 [Hermanssonia centrifuga]